MGTVVKKITVPWVREARARGERLVMVTAYDYPVTSSGVSRSRSRSSITMFVSGGTGRTAG